MSNATPWITEDLYKASPTGAAFGRVEQLSCKAVSGWVLVKGCSSQLSLQIFFKNELVAEVDCETIRSDVHLASGSSEGRHFFTEIGAFRKKSYIELLECVSVQIKGYGIKISIDYANTQTYAAPKANSRSLSSYLGDRALKFSVVIPVYDRVQLLRESIASILNQTYANFELILVGDNPPAATLAVLEEYRNHPKVKMFIYPDRSGNACRGRNTAITMASGDIVAFQDSDDVAYPRRLETAAYVFSNMCGGQITLLYTGVRVLTDGTRGVSGLKFGDEISPQLLPLESLKIDNPMFTCTVCVRRDVLLLRGAFRREMIYREDHELWLRLAYNGAEFHIVPEPQSLYRIHGGNAELLFITEDQKWKQRMLEAYDKPWQANWLV